MDLLKIRDLQSRAVLPVQYSEKICSYLFATESIFFSPALLPESFHAIGRSNMHFPVAHERRNRALYLKHLSAPFPLSKSRPGKEQNLLLHAVRFHKKVQDLTN